ncbi:MAG TPA: hypothetical protein VK027_01185 [Chitinophagaceae bacterium]|nr:hypothetical protein [Chitinophagaceae bacterium]
MIQLQNIYTERSNDRVYLKSDCIIGGEQQTLWYATASEHEKHISITNADAFILFIFIYAVRENLEFKSIVPISKRLKFGLLEVLLPAFQEMGFQAKTEQFSFEQEDETTYPEAKAVGTAMSFGVDSFFTFIKGLNSIEQLNYLTLFNAGAFGQDGGKKAAELFQDMKSKVHDFASENNLGFIWIDTNLNEIFKMPFVQSHTYRNFSCVLMLQKLFKTYYYASTFSVKDFKLTQSDSSNYELLNSKAIATNSIEFHVSGLMQNRTNKTKVIAGSEITFDNLNVCLITPDNKNIKTANRTQNCSKCFKCIRTMVTLDIIGELNKFSKVFDLAVYNKNKNKYLASLLYKKYRAKDDYAKDIFKEAKVQKYHIAPIVYYYAVLRAFQPILRKIKNA